MQTGACSRGRCNVSFDIDVSFAGGKRVSARVGRHVIMTDEPYELGGEDKHPGAYDLYLASLATSAGVYALGYMQARQLPIDGLHVRLRVDNDARSQTTKSVRIELVLPRGTAEKHREAILRAVMHCRVLQTMSNAPQLSLGFAADEPTAPTPTPRRA